MKPKSSRTVKVKIVRTGRSKPIPINENNENWNRRKKETELRNTVEFYENLIEHQNSPQPATFRYLEKLKKNLGEFLERDFCKSFPD